MLFQIVNVDRSLPSTMLESSKANTVLHPTSQQVKHVDENFVPSFNQSLKQISSSRVLQILANERSWLAASEVTKAIVIGLEHRQLVIASEEVSWLGVPFATIDANTGGQCSPEAVSIYPVMRRSTPVSASSVTTSNGDTNSTNSDAKNKDGNGNKRKNRKANNDPLTSADVRMTATKRGHFSSMEDFVAHEEIFLNGIFNVLCQVI
jgi:hypothetical protein